MLPAWPAGSLQAGEPAPIVFSAGPTPTPASADRWRGWTSAVARPELGSARIGGRHSESTAVDEVDPETGTADEPPTRPPVNAETSGRGNRSGPPDRRLERLVRGRSDSAGRVPFLRRQLLARAGIALLAGLLVVVLAVQVGVWWSGWEQPDAPRGADPASAADPAGDPDWSDVVLRLDAARARAMGAADPRLLADVYLDSGSAAHTADAAAIAQLADNGLRVVDGVHQIVSVTVDSVTVDTAITSTAGAPSDGAVRLAVVDTLPAHPIVDASGRQVGMTPTRAEQRRILVLRMTDSGYRISGVEPG